MQNALWTVKLSLTLACVILGFHFQTQAVPLAPLPSASKLIQGFALHTNYVTLDLDFAPFAKLREQVETHLRSELKHRGEAHITLITPPEWKILAKKLKPSDYESLAREQALTRAIFIPLCIGRGQKDSLSTFFVVVKSRKLVEFRQALSELYVRRGGGPEFDATRFFPHITLGFSDRDLHEQDGVLKDKKSCFLYWDQP